MKLAEDERLKPVLELARSCEYEAPHVHQVTRLALRLFDELKSLHKLGENERFWLECAALLHDIGWIEGKKGHHKTALRIIQETDILTFDSQERIIIGSIARYHRKALPKKKHVHFMTLESSERKTVSILAGILRIADGLDRTHLSVVEDVSCEIKPEEIILYCYVSRLGEEERKIALKKGELLEQVFNRKLIIELVLQLHFRRFFKDPVFIRRES